MKCTLSKLDKLNIGSKVFASFRVDFIDSVNDEAERTPDAWTRTDEVHGTLCDYITETFDIDQYVSIPIRNQDDEDGGYIHVHGWKVSIK